MLKTLIRMPKCAGILLILLLAFACAASANSIYNLDGTFATTKFLAGPLNGGTFSGTFSASLPLTDGSESIGSFNIELLNSSGKLIADLTSSDAVGSESTEFCVAGKCDDVFSFKSSSSQLLLVMTGNSKVVPVVSYGWDGKDHLSDISLIASGRIGAGGASAAEPDTFLMLGLALMAGLWIGRKRVFAKALTA
jgi:hypothetical protein